MSTTAPAFAAPARLVLLSERWDVHKASDAANAANAAAASAAAAAAAAAVAAAAALAVVAVAPATVADAYYTLPY